MIETHKLSQRIIPAPFIYGVGQSALNLGPVRQLIIRQGQFRSDGTHFQSLCVLSKPMSRPTKVRDRLRSKHRVFRNWSTAFSY